MDAKTWVETVHDTLTDILKWYTPEGKRRTLAILLVTFVSQPVSHPESFELLTFRQDFTAYLKKTRGLSLAGEEAEWWDKRLIDECM